MRAKPDDGLRPLFRKHLPHFDWQSVETGGTGRGVPDSNYCFGGVEGWVEFKSTDGWTVTLRPEQIGWIARRTRCGGRVWIAVRRRTEGGPRSPATDDLWLIPGALAVTARQGGLRAVHGRPGVRVWSSDAPNGAPLGPATWQWAAVADTLLSSFSRA